MDLEVFPAERTHFFQVSIKLAQPSPAPELRTIIYGHEDFSENLLRLFFRNNLARLKITSEVKNNHKRLFSSLF